MYAKLRVQNCVSTYEIHSMLVACYGLVHGNDIVTNTYEIHGMLVACYGLVHGNDLVIYTYDICQIHITFYLDKAYNYRCYWYMNLRCMLTACND